MNKEYMKKVLKQKDSFDNIDEEKKDRDMITLTYQLLSFLFILLIFFELIGCSQNKFTYKENNDFIKDPCVGVNCNYTNFRCLLFVGINNEKGEDYFWSFVDYVENHAPQSLQKTDNTLDLFYKNDKQMKDGFRFCYKFTKFLYQNKGVK
jgi:hypothetical protein